MESYTRREVGTGVGKADLIVYMAYDKVAEGAAFKGVVARANSGTVCKPYSAQKAHLIIEWQESKPEFGSVNSF